MLILETESLENRKEAEIISPRDNNFVHLFPFNSNFISRNIPSSELSDKALVATMNEERLFTNGPTEIPINLSDRCAAVSSISIRLLIVFLMANFVNPVSPKQAMVKLSLANKE